MGIAINKLPPGYGAEITGVDLTGPVDEATFSEIEQAFETYSLLVFHGQDFDDESQIAFTDRFGPQEVTVPAVVGDRTEIANLSNVDGADKMTSFVEEGYDWMPVPDGDLAEAGMNQYSSFNGFSGRMYDENASVIEELMPGQGSVSGHLLYAYDYANREVKEEAPETEDGDREMVPEGE